MPVLLALGMGHPIYADTMNLLGEKANGFTLSLPNFQFFAFLTTLWKQIFNPTIIFFQLAQECDDEIEKKKRTEEMLHISQRIEFSPDIRWIPIMKSSRYLVLQTKVQHFVFRDKAMRKLGLQLFLFDDILMVTKKSGDRPAA